jgi:uracil-DNA glycosylase
MRDFSLRLLEARSHQDIMMIEDLLAEPTEQALQAAFPTKQTIDSCTRCALYRNATQGVAGDGPSAAPIMFVGEQPGDQEDLAGKPFVGPAGRLFDVALLRSGIERTQVYITNAVKHFKFEPRGKRRIHQKPNSAEVDACRLWIGSEIQHVQPRLIVALGATAASSLTGQALPVQRHRGRILQSADWPADPRGRGAIAVGQRRPDLLITVHPSFLLRLVGEADKKREWHAFLADLAIAARYQEVDANKDVAAL